MTALERLLSVAEVADLLGETPTYVQQQCRRQLWPHRRLARGRIAFTAEDYAGVLELCAQDVAAPDNPRMAFAPRSRKHIA